MPGPKLLIEQWLPIEAIGAECSREGALGKNTFPPTHRLHVWWARRPLTVSRAAILASLLPAYPEDDPEIPPFPDRFRSLFPTFDSYKKWFLGLLCIRGNPAAGRRLIGWAKTKGVTLTPGLIGKLPARWREGLPSTMTSNVPYGYPRAFTINPSDEHLEQLYDLLESTWGTRTITFCDPMSGGGSIPFEALRYGLRVHANELNPVASVILKATLEYPARFGTSLVEDIRKHGRIWCERVRERLEPFYPLATPDEKIFAYLWTRTVACPETGKTVPLSPNWWLRKGSAPMAVKVIADPKEDRCRFEIVRGAPACAKANPDKGTVKRGTGISPWTGTSIDGEYIKAEAQAGRMGQQLYAVGSKRPGGLTFRLPTQEDEEASVRASEQLKKQWATWEARSLIPEEPRREGRADWACEIYGTTRWCDTYSPRQLLSAVTMVESLKAVMMDAENELEHSRAIAVQAFLALVIGKVADNNSLQSTWECSREKIAHSFKRHDFNMCWSTAEYDASRNLLPWSVQQVADSASAITAFLSSDGRSMFRNLGESLPLITVGPAQNLVGIAEGQIRLVCVDPPYYDNVM